MLAGEKAADVDVSVAVAAVEAAYDRNIDMVAIASRDADYLPAVQAIKKLGKEILIIGAEPGFSKALQRGADYVEILRTKSSSQHEQGQQRPQQYSRYHHQRHHYQQQRPHHPQNPQHAQEHAQQKEQPKPQ
jgi:uncharacterized LabA/DUF88 family protein